MSGRRLPPARAARFVAWGNAFLGGWTSLDEAAQQIQAADVWHRVDGLRGGDDASLAVALGRLAVGGVSGLRLVLPVPGDISSLPGPLEFNMEALAAGEAVVCLGAAVGLVPTVVQTGDAGTYAVRWRLGPTERSDPVGPSLGEADRELARSVREATAALTALDVAGAGADAERGLEQLRAGLLDPRLPPGYDARACEVLARARRIAALVALAGEEEGTAVSAAAMAARRHELVTLAASARRAVEAAHNAPLEPSPPR